MDLPRTLTLNVFSAMPALLEATQAYFPPLRVVTGPSTSVWPRLWPSGRTWPLCSQVTEGVGCPVTSHGNTRSPPSFTRNSSVRSERAIMGGSVTPRDSLFWRNIVLVPIRLFEDLNKALRPIGNQVKALGSSLVNLQTPCITTSSLLIKWPWKQIHWYLKQQLSVVEHNRLLFFLPTPTTLPSLLPV